MSSSTSVGCFFLDTNIILSDILKENNPRIEKLKKDSALYKVPCYISGSVRKETHDKVKETCDFLGKVVRETIKYELEQSRQRKNISVTASMTSDDIKALEDLFSYYYSAQKTTGVGLPSPITLIEEWVMVFLGEKLTQGVAIDINQFLVELVKKLLTLTSSLEDLYDNLVTFQRGFVKRKNVPVSSSTVNILQSLGIHDPDYYHIAGAISHQNCSSEKTVFVTLDFSSILDKRYLIRNRLRLECCDPLYSLHHLF